MDKRLKELKNQFEVNIPVSFTKDDKQAVLNKIHEEKQIQRQKHLPKVLTITLILATVIFISIIIKYNAPTETDTANEQVSLSGEESSQMEAEVAEDAEITLYTKEPSELELLFDPETIQVGDRINGVEVLDIVEEKATTIISLKFHQTLSGDVINQDGVLEFIPNEKAKAQIPIALPDQNRHVPIYFQETEATEKLLSMEESNSEATTSQNELNITIEKLEYKYSPFGSSIFIKLEE